MSVSSHRKNKENGTFLILADVFPGGTKNQSSARPTKVSANVFLFAVRLRRRGIFIHANWSCLFRANAYLGRAIDQATLAKRREVMLARKSEAWKPRKRSRRLSMALKAYAALTTSAARGAVRIVPE
jgi:hypothetical protein